MPNYAVGTSRPAITPDKGSGAWCSEPASVANRAAKTVLVPALDGAALNWAVGPVATAQMKHYMSNTGTDYVHDVAKLIKMSHYLRKLFTWESDQAKAFCEQLDPGQGIPICSTRANGGYFRKDTDPHLYWAIGGFSYWGEGLVDIHEFDNRVRTLSLKFEFHIYDRYNWDTGKAVEITTPWDGLMERKHRIDDTQLQEFHRQCLAQEYNVRGLAQQTFEWTIQMRRNPFDLLGTPEKATGKSPTYNPFSALKN